MSLRLYLVVGAPITGVSKVCEAKNAPLLVENEEWGHKMYSFDWERCGKAWEEATRFLSESQYF